MKDAKGANRAEGSGAGSGSGLQQPRRSGNESPAPEHEHEWQPNGTVEVDRIQRSPCSVYDDALWTEVLSVAVCRCGQTKRTRVGTKNMRRRGDSIRRQAYQR